MRVCVRVRARVCVCEREELREREGPALLVVECVVGCMRRRRKLARSQGHLTPNTLSHTQSLPRFHLSRVATSHPPMPPRSPTPTPYTGTSGSSCLVSFP